MKFARVQGHGALNPDGASIRLVVAVDSSLNSEIVRQEDVPWLSFGPVGDITWQVDQYTQETIGHYLADQGWEAISEDPRPARVSDGLYHSATYVIRQMSPNEEGDA